MSTPAKVWIRAFDKLGPMRNDLIDLEKGM